MTEHTANEQLLDDSVRHQIYVLRLAGGLGNKIIALLNRVDDDLVRKIQRRSPLSGQWTTKRLETLLDDIRAINAEVYKNVKTELTGELIELAKYETDFQSRRLSAAAPIDLNITQPPLPVIKAAVTARPFQGRLLSEWLTGLETWKQAAIRDQIRIGVLAGEPIDAIVRRIRGTRALNYRDGLLETGRRQAQALVRTAVNHTITAARLDLYAQNQDVIKGEQIVATLDGRTTPVCRSQDGKVYPIGKGPRPPFHIGCRTTVTPVLKSWKELGINLKEAPPGTRSSMDGQVPESLNYDQWLRKQQAEFQDEVLGKTKGKLFRDGGLTMDKFVDRAGNELTLAELRVTETAAFSRAGLDK